MLKFYCIVMPVDTQSFNRLCLVHCYIVYTLTLDTAGLDIRQHLEVTFIYFVLVKRIRGHLGPGFFTLFSRVVLV